jgi:hypothetical protein
MPGLSTQQRQSVSRISGLVLINALVFQEILAEHNLRVRPIQKILNIGHPIPLFSREWKFILEKINYYPIFHVAVEILENLTTTKEITKTIEELAKTAQQIVGYRAALRHDLMGRVYHRLLGKAAKYLGTYYTSIPAATLLLKLALRHDALVRDAEILKEYRAADLACGTGTLLMAAADAVTDLYIRAQLGTSEEFDLTKLHKILSEKVIHGYDVLPSATHLTASTLALRAPQISFKKMNLISLPLGGRHNRLGSIEFLEDHYITEYTDLFGAVKATDVEQVTGSGLEKLKQTTVPPLDLCIMNPPFTRSVGGNLLFGSLPDAQRTKMQKRLAKLLKEKKVSANTTAGLGSVFVGLADRFMKPGGRIGLVLPKTVLSGVAWNRTRQLLRGQYRVEYIVASHDPERWNFSENTDLSEVLLVAVKEKRGVEADGKVVAINLWRNPTTTFEALAINSAIPDEVPGVERTQGALQIKLGEDKVGEAISISWKDLRGRYSWILPSAFAQSDLVRAAHHLLSGKLWLPGIKGQHQLLFCTLGDLGKLGPDARDIHDGFAFSDGKTIYPAFLDHRASIVTTIRQNPNGYLTPLGLPKPGRPLRKLEHLWPLAGTILLAERLRLNTQRLAAVSLSEPVLSNMWWTFSSREDALSVEKRKGLVLWLNSSLAFLILLVNREETQGAWGKFKKPVLEAMPVLDVASLTKKQVKKLAAAYDEIATQRLEPFPYMATDKARAAIDAAIADALGLPDFSVLRALLAQEPVVCLNRL